MINFMVYGFVIVQFSWDFIAVVIVVLKFTYIWLASAWQMASRPP